MPLDKKVRNDSRGTQQPPRVSVITAVKNAENFITEAVESILGQSLQDLEYLIVDDNSADGTLGKISRLPDPRIQVISLPQSVGPCAARNVAISKSRGHLIAILDGDDIAHPERLDRQVSFLEENPSVGAVGSWARVFGEYETVRRPPLASNALKASLLWGNPFVHSTMTVRRAALPRGSEPYRPSELYAEDYGLWLRIATNWELANLDLELIRYRSHANQLSELNIALAEKSFIAARNEFLSHMELRELTSLTPSFDDLINIARGLESRGWLESETVYRSWLRSRFTALKNATLDEAQRNRIVRWFVTLGRRAKTQKKSTP